MSILDDIIEQKKAEIQTLHQRNWTENKQTKTHSFLEKLNQNKLHLIAEIKKASPSKGIIYQNFNPQELATHFESNGASCISVLTDERFFKGHKDFLMAVKETVHLPVLRKDFIIDPIQVKETKHMGADVMLLILDILSDQQTNELIEAAREEKLDVLLEIHSALALERLNEIQDKPIVGINNRDLHTFDCQTSHALHMAKTIKDINPTIKIIAESGYSQAKEMEELEKNNINGVLIGEGLSKNKGLLEWFSHEN